MISWPSCNLFIHYFFLSDTQRFHFSVVDTVYISIQSLHLGNWTGRLQSSSAICPVLQGGSGETTSFVDPHKDLWIATVDGEVVSHPTYGMVFFSNFYGGSKD